ncbi:MAG: hypothetical protein IJW51_03095 [Clostridia bacterium]|nr:hypothetical protein [Clostridia bacterium]
MKKTLLICTLTLLLFLSAGMPSGATEQAPAQQTAVTVVDMLDVLTPTEERSLAPAIDTHGISFYLITMETAFSDDRLSDHQVYSVCNFGEEALYRVPDAIVLVVRLVSAEGTFYYDMYTYGEAYDIFSNYDVDRTLDADEVYGNLKSGNIADGATAFFRLCATEIDGHYEALAAKERRRPLVVALIAVGTGVLAGGISVLAVFLCYRKKQHGETYPLDRYARLNLTHREDRFVGSFVTRVRVRSEGGGHHGSGGGGGFRGGGGGGFRGGR